MQLVSQIYHACHVAQTSNIIFYHPAQTQLCDAFKKRSRQTVSRALNSLDSQLSARQKSQSATKAGPGTAVANQPRRSTNALSAGASSNLITLVPSTGGCADESECELACPAGLAIARRRW